jgi:hypothetical protein
MAWYWWPVIIVLSAFGAIFFINLAFDILERHDRKKHG